MVKYKQRFVHNSASFALFQLVQLTCTLFLTPFAINTLGALQFGLWAVISTLTSHVISADLGMGASYLKFISHFYSRDDNEGLNAVVNTGLIFNLVLFGPLLVLVWVFRRWLFRLLQLGDWAAAVLNPLLAMMLLVALVTVVSSSYTATLTATQRLRLASRISMAAVLARTLTAWLLLTRGWGIMAMVLGEFVFVTLLHGMSLAFARIRIPGLRFHPRFFRMTTLRQMLRYGLQLQVSQLALLAHQQTDKLLLSHLSGLASVTLYQIAQQLANLLRLVTSFLGPVVIPAAAEFTARDDTERLSVLTSRGLRYVSTLVLALGGFLYLNAQDILNVWMGHPGFEDCAQVLKILVPAYAMARLGGFLSGVLRGTGQVAIEMRTSLLLLCTQVPLSYFFISRFGLPGAPVAVLLATLMSQLYLIWQFRRLRSGYFSGVLLFEVKLLTSIAIGGVALLAVKSFVPPAWYFLRLPGIGLLLAESVLYGTMVVGILLILRGLRTDELGSLVGALLAPRPRD